MHGYHHHERRLDTPLAPAILPTYNVTKVLRWNPTMRTEHQNNTIMITTYYIEQYLALFTLSVLRRCFLLRPLAAAAAAVIAAAALAIFARLGHRPL